MLIFSECSDGIPSPSDIWISSYKIGINSTIYLKYPYCRSVHILLSLPRVLNEYDNLVRIMTAMPKYTKVSLEIM